MSRFTNALRVALEEIAEDLDGSQAPAADAAEDTVVDVAAEPAAADDAAAANVEVVDAADDAAAAADRAADAADAAAGAAADASAAAADAADAVEVVSASDDNVIVDTSDSAEDAVAEAAAAEDDVQDTVEQTEELEEAAAGLESIYNMLAAAQQKGGLTPQAAKAATIAVESYTRRVGIDTPVMMGLESFGRDSSRMRATSLSMEAIKDQLKTIWKAIWNFLVNLKNKIWNFIKRLFSATERLSQRADKLLALKLSGTASNTEPLKIKGYAKKVAIGTSIQLDPSKGFAELIKLASEAGSYQATISANTKKALDAISAGTDVNSVTVEAIPMPKSFTVEGDTAKTVTLPGNVHFEATKKQYLGGKLSVWRYKKVQEEAKISEEAKIPVLSADGIAKVANAAKALLKAVDEAQKASEEGFKQAKANSQKSAANAKTDDAAKADVAAMYAIRDCEAQGAKLNALICSAAVQAGLVYLKIAEMSAARFGKAKAEVKK